MILQFVNEVYVSSLHTYYLGFRNYNPDYMDLFNQAVNWLASPGGNLIWDAVLQILGIVITVFFIQRWVAKREENRWLPLKHLTYMLLLGLTDKLVRELAPQEPKEQKAYFCRFGDRNATSALTTEFGDEIRSWNAKAFIPRTTEIIEHHPKLLPDIYQEFREFVDRGSVALASEPELNTLLADLDLSLTSALKAFNSPRETASNLLLAQHFKWVAQNAHELNEWLKSQADQVSDATSLLEQFQDSRERSQTHKNPNEQNNSEKPS